MSPLEQLTDGLQLAVNVRVLNDHRGDVAPDVGSDVAPLRNGEDLWLVPRSPAVGSQDAHEALVDRYRPDDAALQELACIVHGADFAEETRLVPESAGLRSISGGFPLVAQDDHEILERAGFLYDALYASLKARSGARG